MTQKIEEFIIKDVVYQLVWDEYVDTNNIRVKVAGTTVWLNGTVKNYSEKIAAGKDAYNVLGVTDVKNNLSVKYSSEVILPDEENITQNEVI